MYKLLLVSDRDDVLEAFEQVESWERQGFKQPHIRHDYEGTLDSLSKHHADGIAVAVNPEEEKRSSHTFRRTIRMYRFSRLEQHPRKYYVI